MTYAITWAEWVADALKQIAPRIKRVAIIFNPETAPFSKSFVRVVEAAAPTFAIETVSATVRDAAELEKALASFAGKPDSGVIVLPDLFTTSHRDTIVALAARNRLPAIYPFRYFAASGGLVSDGVDSADLFRRSASYVDRILKGANPAISLYRRQPSSSWSSTSRLRRHSTSLSRLPCSPAPTK